MKLQSPSGAEFDPLVLKQLRGVIDKFGLSLEGSLAHQNLVGEIAERERAEQLLARRARQLELIADTSQQIAAVSATGAVHQDIVRLIAETLGYSQVQLFRSTLTAKTLVLTASAGEASDKAEVVGSSVPYGQGVLGAAATTGQPVLIPDVTQDVSGLADSAVPGVRGELAVPIMLGDALLGVLRVRSDAAHSLTEDDQGILLGLSGQIANALENARLFEEVQSALAEVEAVQRRYVREQWAHYVPERGLADYDYVRSESKAAGDTVMGEKLRDLILPAQARELDRLVQRAMARRETVSLSDTAAGSDVGGTDQASLVVPVQLRGEVIGALGVRSPQGERRWKAEEIALVEAVVDQMAQAIESARLLDETQRREAQERLTGEIAARMRETLDVDTVLRTAAQEIRQALGLSRMTVRLATEPDEPNKD